MNMANKDWCRATLNPVFQPFIDRWRDDQSPQASLFSHWIVNGAHLGHIENQRLDAIEQALVAAGLPSGLGPSGLETEAPDNPEAFSAALVSLGQRLRALNLVPGWRDEEQLLRNRNGHILARAERALFKTLGLQSRAVHVHVENHLGQVWTGVRANTKHENPGMLDNLAAGGIASAESADSTLWRELNEEAGLEPEDFAWIKPFDMHELVLSRPLLYGGWHQETVIFFHGQLKQGRRPRNRDGEVAAFQLMSAKACTAAINGWQFTPDAALCCALALSATECRKKD